MQTQQTTFRPAAPALEYVGVGRRFFAVLIDEIVLSIIGAIIVMVFHLGAPNASGVAAYTSGPSGATQVIIFLIYYIVLEAMAGATLGKMLLGLRVVNLDGSRISWKESIIRN